LSTTLGGVQVQITDSAGVTRNAPLFYVSPTQISFQDPSGASAGAATITVLLNGSTVGQGTTVVEQVTPGLFTANSNGQGVAAAIALRVKADGSQEPITRSTSSATRTRGTDESCHEAKPEMACSMPGEHRPVTPRKRTKERTATTMLLA